MLPLYVSGIIILDQLHDVNHDPIHVICDHDSPCNVYPLVTHLYIAKLAWGIQGFSYFFLIFDPKHHEIVGTR